MAWTLKAAPLSGEAVIPLELAIEHVKADGEDALVAALRDAAVGWIERHTAKALVRRQHVWTIERPFGLLPIPLPIGPDAQIEQVAALDTAGIVTSLATSILWQREAGVVVSGPVGLDTTRLRITMIVGFDDVAAEAPQLVTAALMLTAHLYRNREAVATQAMNEVPFGVDALTAQFRDPVIA